MTSAWLPFGTSVEQMAGADCLAGADERRPWLGAGGADLSGRHAGNRVFDSLYDAALPPLAGDCPGWWSAVESGRNPLPPKSYPGCSPRPSLRRSDVRARGGASCTFSAGRIWDGSRSTSKKLSGIPRPHVRPHLEVRAASPGRLSSLARTPRRRSADCDRGRRRPATGRSRSGSRGRGSTGPDLGHHPHRRLRALDRHRPDDPRTLGLAVPSQMSGQPIRSEGVVDPAAVEARGDRMAVISDAAGR